MTSPQRTLFDVEPSAMELNETHHWVASVVLARGPQGTFDYLVPDSLRGELEAGRRLEVPFGRRSSMIGYCVEVKAHQPGGRKLKPIGRVVDEQSLLSPAMIELTRWIADHYLTSWGQVLEAVVPSGVRGQAGMRSVKWISLAEGVGEEAAELKLPAKQARVVATLLASSDALPAAELARMSDCTQAPIQSLIKKGLLQAETRREHRLTRPDSSPPRTAPLELNSDQQTALQAITRLVDSGRHQTVLIHGVTGSGKTEVYIQAIERVVSAGREAIVLVPEISLTPQTKRRFCARFDRVAVLHSHMSDTERHGYWKQIAAGEIQVVVGARSAVFAPTHRLGLIVLDEEHDGSFKQESAPRYHARDIALRRAEALGVPAILGSATPSLESWQRAVEGTFQLVEMPRRIFDRPMPAVRTVDLRMEARGRYTRGAISRPLHQAMTAALADDGQVILLLNRRGFSTHIQCRPCGWVMRCPQCEVALTHHRAKEAAVCHYCNYQSLAPSECPECHSPAIRYGGLGTQRLEAEVRARFPDSPCLRMDTDSMRRRGSHKKALDAFQKGDVQILLGTQMIAKGLDFPNVTLVGVVNADTALHLPDFRAAERTFQLIAQVAGRTGRGEKGGRVLVQTSEPDHPAIEAAVQHDFTRFADYELPARQQFGYPPFATMVRLVVRGAAERTALMFAEQLAGRLKDENEQLNNPARIVGPAPAPIPRIRGKFRFHIQVQAADGHTLIEAVRRTMRELKPPKDIQWIADIDPLDML